MLCLLAFYAIKHLGNSLCKTQHWKSNSNAVLCMCCSLKAKHQAQDALPKCVSNTGS